MQILKEKYFIILICNTYLYTPFIHFIIMLKELCYLF